MIGPDPQHTHNVLAELAAAWVGPCVAHYRRARLELNALVLEGLEADDTGTEGVWVERARVAYSTTNPDPSARFTVWGNAGGLTLSQRLPTVEAACGEVRHTFGLLPEPAVTQAPKPAAAPWTLTPNVPDPCTLALEAGALLVEIVELLDRKNKAYGNSATQPLAVFSRLGALDRLAVRIDDKLSRISRGSEDAKADVPEDTVLDLIGYLVIYLLESRKG